jgi:hypothetical protein
MYVKNLKEFEYFKIKKMASGGAAASDSIIHPQENELTNLSHAIIEWRRLTDEITGFRQEIKERNKKLKALETVICRIMKNHNISALDLKNSGGRVLYKKQKKQSGLGQKNLQKYLAEYMKSEDEAKKAMEFVQGKRTVVDTESIKYETLETADA